MKVLKPFPIPEEPPIIPQGLVDCVLGVWSDLKKVDIMRARKGGWQVVNSIGIEESDDPSEVTERIKMCADQHALALGESGKYRAQLWSVEVGRNGVRNYNTFHVQSPGDEEDPIQTTAEEEIQALRGQWTELFEAQQEFAKLLMRFSEFSIERVVAMSKQNGEQLNPLTEVIQELIRPYRDGLQMQSRAIKEMGDMRVRQHLAEARADDNGKFWEMFGPAVQIAASQASQRFLGGGGKAARPAAGRSASRTKVVTHAAPPTAASPPTPTPTRAQAKSATAARPEAGPTAPEPEAASVEPDSMPRTLHGLARALLDNMSSDALVKVSRVLEDDQASCFVQIAEATDDDTAAESIVALMHSLMRTPTALVQMQQFLGPDHIQAFQQVAMLAKQYLDERDAAASSAEAAAQGAELAEDAKPSEAPRAATPARRQPPHAPESGAKAGKASRFAPPTATDSASTDDRGASTDATSAAETEAEAADDPRG